MLRSHLSGTRPITWAEVHRLVEEAKERISLLEGEGREIDPAARDAVKNLEARIYERFTGSARLGTGPVYAALHDPGIGVEYLEGDPSTIPVIKSSQHALVYNNGGIDPGEGTNANVTVETEGALGPFHLQLYPRITTSDRDRELFHRGSLRVGGLGGLELIAGKESLWWGQGAHGGMHLTNNAGPLPMVHLSTPHPATLPWIFRYLGPCRFEMFLSRLEEGRAVPEPWFMGIRSNFRPVYALEIGLSVMIMTGGEGRPDVSFGDLFDILFGENEIGNEDRSNKIAGYDFRLNLRDYQVYLEFAGEDEVGTLPSKMAGLVGLYYPRLTGTVDLRVEYADLAFDEPGVWYRHGIYTDGYTYDGRILGHHVGGGGRDLFAEVTFGMGERGRGRVGVDLEQRGIDVQPRIERHSQLLLGWEGLLSLGGIDCTLDLAAAVDRISNEGYVEGEEGTGFYVSMNLGMDM
jgi:hypothetical protein